MVRLSFRMVSLDKTGRHMVCSVMTQSHFDVLIIGAGLSGIGAAYHLQTRCPGKSYAILEQRSSSGGTWDLFRYPGIRSDSDMHTLGYNFKPWTQQKAIADGPAILNYVRETAAENGIEPNIHYDHKVVRARWSSPDARWFVDVEVDGEARTYSASFLHSCAGYYRYDQGYTPDFEGLSDFKGRIIHPQHWPDDLDYEGKKVVIIGSGATAVTLVPAMAETASHVTMLQRSPSYVVSRPAEDQMAIRLRRWFGPRAGYHIVRWRNILLQRFFFNRARSHPEKVRQALLNGVREQLGPDYDIETHFTPAYNPWDQRLCLVPDSDLFEAIRAQRASVVTDHIARFTETGIELQSGESLDADIVVTATGLDLQFLGGMEIVVDGRPLVPSEQLNYRGCMVSDVPNLVTVFGYTNASWTLRADLSSEFMCRLVNRLDAENFVEVRPVATDVEGDEDFLDFSSGYVQRAMGRFPRRSSKAPWVLTQNYVEDIWLIRFGRLDDGALVFRRAHESLADAGTALHAAE